MDYACLWECRVCGGIARSREAPGITRAGPESFMLHPKAIEKRAVQESNTDLQQGVRARRTPAHLLFLAHPVIDQMVHDRFNMRRGDPAPGGPCLCKTPAAAAGTAPKAPEFVPLAGPPGGGGASHAG